MGIRYTKFRTYKRTVTVAQPSQTEVDKDEKVSFVAVFNRPPREQLEAHHSKTFECEDAKVTAFLDLILAGAEGFEDDDGVPLSPTQCREIVVGDFAFTMGVIEKFNADYLGAAKGN